MKRTLAYGVWCLTALFAQSGLGVAQSEPVLYTGLSDQATQTIFLRRDPFQKTAKAQMVLMPARATTRFLGPEAHFKVVVHTDQLWAQLNPAATSINDVPKTEGEHDSVGAAITVSFLKSGNVVSSRRVEAVTSGSFHPPVYCPRRSHGCHGQLTRAAFIEKATGDFVVPASGMADELRIEAEARDAATNQSVSFASLRRPLLTGEPIHIYAQDSQEPGSDLNRVFDFLPFRILEGPALKDGVATEVIYSGERADNIVQGVHETQPWTPNYPEILKAFNSTVVCNNGGQTITAGVVDGAYEDYRSMVEVISLKYRYDGGSWSALIPFEEAAVDATLKSSLFNQGLNARELFQGAIIPAAHGHKKLEIAFQLSIYVDYDSTIETMATEREFGVGVAESCHDFPKGTLIPVGNIWDTPTKDASSGWEFTISQ